MREILFRGIAAYDNETLVYGSLTPDNSIMFREPDCEHIFKRVPVIPETISEYTGRCDVNKIKVFENDVVLNLEDREYYIVVFKDAEFWLYSEKLGVYKHMWAQNIRVVGNSYQIEQDEENID